MKENFVRLYGIIIMLGIAGAVTFALLLKDVAPAASIRLDYSRSEIIGIGQTYLEKLGFEVTQYQADANFLFGASNHLYLQTLYGMRKANEIVAADSLPVHIWVVEYYDKNLQPSQFVESFRVWVSPGGRIQGFQQNIVDTAARPSLSKEVAYSLALTFLQDQGIEIDSYELKTSSSTQRLKRLDHRFELSAKDTTKDKSIWVSVLGSRVGGFRTNLEAPEELRRQISETSSNATSLFVVSFVAIFLLFFFVVILFLKKYHEGEVGTKTAFLVFAGVYVSLLLFGINNFPTIGFGVGMGDQNRFYVRLATAGMTMLIFYFFLSVLTFAAWSVGESSSRSTWPEKMAAIDGALFRKYFTFDVASSIVRGYALGFFILGIYALLIHLIISNTFTGIFARSAGGLADAYIPGLRPVFTGISIALISEIVYRLFFITSIKEKTKKTWLGVFVSMVIWVICAITLWEMPFGFLRMTETLAVLAVFGLTFAFIYLRYDLLTAIVANFIIIAMNDAIPLFVADSPNVTQNLWLFAGVLVVPLAVAATGFVRNEKFEFTKETVPAHILRISERERMSKELEIARRVQMSLLPKSSPTTAGFDISGTCIPALEVGGDYYDFVHLPDNRIGIAIGDVSGKGVPAAIYMTLTKGILQSHAEENVSPKRVLSKVNSLMYRTIDRNSFVSMFYAILDPSSRTIRFARAGQCPVIIAHHGNERGVFLTPKGMALGLEVGKVFDSVLEEQEMPLHHGDVLVFYTDGFTEAMNSAGDEFGEERLAKSIARHRHLTASEIITAISFDVHSFTAGWQQHDDMTIVVVKVV